jgi:hydroxymethylglutaryl-CoA reductase
LKTALGTIVTASSSSDLDNVVCRTIGLPVGIAPYFEINGKSYVVPVAIEEPSVVAAMSGAAKTISQHSLDGGFVATTSSRNIIYAQIQLLDIKEDRVDNAIQMVRLHCVLIRCR